jgi:hypothetical protein
MALPNPHGPYSSSGVEPTAVEIRAGTTALTALSSGAERLAAGATAAEALQAVADAAHAATGAGLAVVRVVEQGELAVRAVAGPAFLAAEIEGLKLADPVPEEDVDEIQLLADGARVMAERARASAVLVLPVRTAGSVVASLELFRTGTDFGPEEREAGEIVCAQIGLVLRAFAGNTTRSSVPAVLELAADALAAGTDGAHAAERIARLVVDRAGAEACLLWGSAEGGGLQLLARVGAVDAESARPLAAAASESRTPTKLDRLGALPAASLPLGHQLGVLQVVFASDAAPSDAELSSLAGFAARAGQV